MILILLLLTGQRRNEIAGLRWDYIDIANHLITLPPRVTKNNREHIFPYGPLAADIIAAIPRSGPLLFPARGHTERHFCGWSKNKRHFDELCALPHWQLHDLRRTWSTGAASIQIAPHVIERVLNHASGTISEIAAIYNRYAYVAEMRDAMERYEEKIRKLIRR